MNKVILVGNIASDLELKMTNNQKMFLYFPLAVNRYKEGVDFISCIAWEKTAEHISSYCKKGSKILVDGRLEVNRKTNSQGVEMTYTNVIVERVEFLSKREITPEEPEMVVTGDDLPF